MTSEEALPPEGKTNFSGIPSATFIEDVDQAMKDNPDANAKLKVLEEQLQKYKFMETSLTTRRQRLKSQLPDLGSSLELIDELEKRKGAETSLETRFLLSDQAYTVAEVPPTDTVCLWLGANVMLEYTLEEARQLVGKNKGNAERTLAEIRFDLDFLRDQMTITEVAVARIYNWNVRNKQRQQDKAGQKGDQE